MHTVTVLTVLAIFLWFVLPYAIRKFQEVNLKRKCRISRTIVLTYDDGPDVEVTERILALLKAFDVRATFFLLGKKIAVAPDLPNRLVQTGHEIGSHSYQHLNAWKRSPLAVYRDIQRGFVCVGVFCRTALFRPPHGKLTLATMLQVLFNRRQFAWWTIDSTDTWFAPMPIAGVIERIRNDGGGVILMHDHSRPDYPDREAYVLDLTRNILELARNEGFRVCRMCEIVSP